MREGKIDERTRGKPCHDGGKRETERGMAGEADTYVFVFIVIIHILVTVLVAVFPHVGVHVGIHIDVEAKANVEVISTFNEFAFLFTS